MPDTVPLQSLSKHFLLYKIIKNPVTLTKITDSDIIVAQ